MLEVQIGDEKKLAALLENHPRVNAVSSHPGTTGLGWEEEGWRRRISVGDSTDALRGVVELTDNNPLVCADRFSVPTAAGTLAVLALGPLAQAGLIVERPTMLVSIASSEEEIAPFLEPLGWAEGLTLVGEEADLGGAVAATVICAVRTPERLEDLDDLYEERYGRTFYMRRDESAEWHVNLVLGQPFALYRLRIAPDEPNSLLTIQIMADAEGKCGAAQLVHAMNVMCGFEESLGLE